MSEHDYTHGYAEPVLASHRWRDAANSAAYLLPRLRPGHRLLDVGAGAGTITVDLAQSVAHVTALEVSDEAVAVTRSAVAAAGVENVEVVRGDARRLEFADGVFDVVHAHQVLQHLDDPVAALREMWRVLAPGGVLAVRDADYAAFAWYPESAGLDRWLDVYRQVARTNGGEPDAGRRLLAWARAAGVTGIVPSSSTWCFANEADRSWWSETWAERVTETRLAEQFRAHGATDAELVEIAAAWRTWAAAPDGWFAVLHGEVLAVKPR